jgi:hypothetical protein
MTTSATTLLALLVCLYAVFEFLLKRLWWNPATERTHTFGASAMKALLLLGILLLGTAGWLSPVLGAGCGIIAAVYLLLDRTGHGASEKAFAKASLERFLVHQTLMGALLLTLWRAATPFTAHEWFTTAGEILFGAAQRQSSATSCTSILAIASAYLFMVDGGTRIVRGILNKFQGLSSRALHPPAYEELHPQPAPPAPASLPPTGKAPGPAHPQTTDDDTDDETKKSIGEWIGILERIITLTFILTNNFTALAFVLTAKSIARFKELEESRDFAEYYLLGTSGSMLVPLGIGIFVRIILGL